jgi:hypothetical protein
MGTLASWRYCASMTWDTMVVAHATMAWGLSMPLMDLATPMLPPLACGPTMGPQHLPSTLTYALLTFLE